MSEDIRVIVVDLADQLVAVDSAEDQLVVVESGPPGPPGPSGPAGADGADGLGGVYIHEQDVPAAVWTINHNLGHYPNVTTMDTAGTQVEGDVLYQDLNTTIIDFGVAFSGKATCT